MSLPSPTSESRSLYLGVDCSTQSLKLTVITREKQILTQVSVGYDRDLPQYRTKDGVIRDSYGTGSDDAGKGTITTPSILFVAALELALERLKQTGLPIHRIASISVSGQQHGSVYWKNGVGELFKRISSVNPLANQLENCFSVRNGPIWMDSSTSLECAALEKALGGAQELANRTGSRAHERFTGEQISRIARVLPEAYAHTERISLVSSMIPTLFLLSYASIDCTDGAGMNLMNLTAEALPFEWDETCLQACVGGHAAGGVKALKAKLGPIVDSPALLGKVASFWTERYGFSPECEVVAGSGDNPCSLVGMQLTKSGELGVSLGTSDTLFAVCPTSSTQPHVDAHVFPNPTDSIHTRMIMLCVKNGSLAREAVKRMVEPAGAAAGNEPVASSASSSSPSGSTAWESFNNLLSSTPAGNNGQFLFAYLEPEITPHTSRGGILFFSKGSDLPSWKMPNEAISSVELAGAMARGVIESQFLNLRSYSQRLGLHAPKRLVVTGGASVNIPVIQVLADVFGCDVEAQTVVDDVTGTARGQVSDTASLGAAFRALASHQLRTAYLQSAIETHSPMGSEDAQISSPSGLNSPPATDILSPVHIATITLVHANRENHQVYSDLLDEFERKQALAVALLSQ